MHCLGHGSVSRRQKVTDVIELLQCIHLANCTYSILLHAANLSHLKRLDGIGKFLQQETLAFCCDTIFHS